MRTSTAELPPASPLDLAIEGIDNKQGQRAAGIALDILAKKLPPRIGQLIAGTRVVVGSGIIDSGGQTDAERKKIMLDADKNALSLQAAEDYLTSEGILDAGDWTKALAGFKDHDWSCLTYQLVHEVGHLLDGLSDGEPYERLSEDFSPTRYGASNSSESFAEAFAYWVFGLDQHPKAEEAVLAVIN